MAGLGTAADRSLEQAIKASISRGTQSHAIEVRPIERCLQCLRPVQQGDDKTPEERRSIRTARIHPVEVWTELMRGCEARPGEGPELREWQERHSCRHSAGWSRELRALSQKKGRAG